MPKLSIIIPVYNSVPYLRQCLDSILTQDFPDWELIIVDDCSSDNSRKIANEYAQKDKRIKLVFHEKNSGPGAARNSGLETATGEFVTFVDSDDWLEKNHYSSLLARQEETRADVVESNLLRCGERATPFPEFKNMSSELDLSKGNDSYLLAIYQRRSGPCVFNKIYRLALIKENNVAFLINQNIKIAVEDLIFLLVLSSYVKSYASINYPSYNYRYLVGSISHKKLKDPVGDVIGVLNFYQSEQKKRKQLISRNAFLAGAIVLIKSATCYSFVQEKKPIANGAAALRRLRKNDFINRGIRKLLFYPPIRFKDRLLVWLLFMRAYWLYSLLFYYHSRRQPGFLQNLKIEKNENTNYK